MTHIELINIAAKANSIAKVINGIIAADRWSIGGSMVLEIHGKLGRDVHDLDLIFEFENRNKAILAYQRLDEVLTMLGISRSKSYTNVANDVWSLEFQTSFIRQPVNILFRETDRTTLNYYLGIMWQPLWAVELWKKKWNRAKDIEDLK